MDVVWSKKFTAFAVSDVLAQLEKERSLAYTTVMTTVVRLYEKGLLRREKEGKRFLYSPKLTREQFLEATAREVLAGVVDRRQALTLLAEQVAEASSAELDELEALIRRRREEQNK